MLRTLCFFIQSGLVRICHLLVVCRLKVIAGYISAALFSISYIKQAVYDNCCGSGLLFINYPRRSSVGCMFDICAVCILTLSSYIVALSLKWVKKRSEPYGFREHNVCSSTTPVFHFLTWKMFPSKRNRKNHFHSDTRSVILTPNVPFFPPPHQHIARPRTRPLPFPPLPL